jgi:CysZ protein
MFSNLIGGITSYGRAIRHISLYGLWGYVFAPGVFCLLIGGGLLWLAWGLSDNIGNLLDNLWRWEFGKPVVSKVASVFGGLFVVSFGLIIIRQLIMVISSPFMSLLSEKVENQLLGKPGSQKLSLPQILSDLLRGLRIALRNLFREIFATVFLLLLGLFPLFTPFTTAAIFIVQAYYAGFGNFDFALERHFGYRESIQFIHRHRSLSLGNGMVFMLLLFTFLGFLFAIPLSTVAATLETTKRLEKIA